MDERELLDGMRAAPDDPGPRLVYADWLLARGDLRGELIVLDEKARSSAPLTVAELDRLLDLASLHGFPKLPDDPCADILPFTGGGSYPTQYTTHHDGHEYYLRWRYGFTIDVDDVTVWEGHLETRTTNEWTFLETTVILSIVSAAIHRRGDSLAGFATRSIVFPDQLGYHAHPYHRLGRSPHFVFPEGLYPEDRVLEVRDFERWYRLHERRLQLTGTVRNPRSFELGCNCGVAGLSCDVVDCDPDRQRSSR